MVLYLLLGQRRLQTDSSSTQHQASFNTTIPDTDSNDVTVDELAEMTRELDKTLTTADADASHCSPTNESQSLSMLSQNEIEALILQQYRGGDKSASTRGIAERSDSGYTMEDEFVTPRQIIDRDPDEWAVPVC